MRDAQTPSGLRMTKKRMRRVTELNAGRKTAGVDGAVVVTAPGKAFLAASVQNHGGQWAPKPVKRVYVAKANGKQRPLGIRTVPAYSRAGQVQPTFGIRCRNPPVPPAFRPEPARPLRKAPPGRRADARLRGRPSRSGDPPGLRLITG